MKKVSTILGVFVLCVLIVITSIPISIAVSGSNSSIKWNINNNGVLTISCKDSSGKAKIANYTASKAAPWKKYSSSIKSVIVNSNITRIGSYAFNGLKKATKITVGKHVKEIGVASFKNCTSLKSFEVASPSTSKAFKTSGGVLYNYNKTTLVAYPANKSGSTFTCPDSVTNIKGFAFYANQNITTFTHNSPGQIKKINGQAFAYSSKLKTVVIRNNCEWFGAKVFYGIKTLRSVTLPPSMNRFGLDVFSSVDSIKELKDLKIYAAKESWAYKVYTNRGYIMKNKKWEFTCKFNSNGGTISSSSKKVTYGETYGTLPSPKKTGYTFKGWYLGSNTITSSTKVTTAASHTLTAQFTANKYTIKLDANGGICNKSSIEVTFNQPFGELPIPTRVGYTFLGWFTTLEDNNDKYDDEDDWYDEEDDWYDEGDEEDYNEVKGEKIFENTIFNNINIKTLYARWQKPVSTVKNISIHYNTKNTVKLSWDEQQEITGYEIYQKVNNGDYQSLTTTPDTNKVVSLNPKNKYTVNFQTRFQEHRHM